MIVCNSIARKIEQKVKNMHWLKIFYAKEYK